ARLYCLSGLDYAEGDNAPKLPALEPNAVATLRWRALPTAPDAPLIAALSLEGADMPKVVRVAPIQHFSETPPAESASVSKLPVARAGRGLATLENGRVRARLAVTNANVPVLFLSTRTAGGWRQAGVALPLAEALSAEGGQRPWREVFKGDEVRVAN